MIETVTLGLESWLSAQEWVLFMQKRSGSNITSGGPQPPLPLAARDPTSSSGLCGDLYSYARAHTPIYII